MPITKVLLLSCWLIDTKLLLKQVSNCWIKWFKMEIKVAVIFWYSKKGKKIAITPYIFNEENSVSKLKFHAL